MSRVARALALEHIEHDIKIRDALHSATAGGEVGAGGDRPTAPIRRTLPVRRKAVEAAKHDTHILGTHCQPPRSPGARRGQDALRGGDGVQDGLETALALAMKVRSFKKSRLSGMPPQAGPHIPRIWCRQHGASS
ncbi:MAG: hypothetical protein L0G46_11170, partial [Kocuria sp.]|nr:hypothetical protein [Kocuria sp.]